MLPRQGAPGEGGKAAARSRTAQDAQLISRIAAGDLRAFEELYQLYHPRLSRFIGNIVRRPHMVSEVLNDTMMVVWSKPHRYNGSSQVSTWIFAIAYRKALKALKRWDEPVEDGLAELRESLEAGPERRLEDRQLHQVLMEAINRLSADHRAVVDLTYFHGASYREIAEIMDCPVDTVKTRVFHARKRLKTLLGGGLADWL